MRKNKFPCKHRFQTYLRQNKIAYKTSANSLQVGQVFIDFRAEEETIIFRSPLLSHISYSTPYSYHTHLLEKYFRFCEIIKSDSNVRIYHRFVYPSPNSLK